MSSPLIETLGLSLRAAGRCLIHDLSWQADTGQRWCVIGRNAAGKTSLLRALAGLPVAQRSGTVQWAGRDQTKWPALDAATLRAFVPQHTQDRFSISVLRLLELSAGVATAPPMRDSLSALDAAHLGERDVMQLSGGERQRAALAQCAVQGTPLLLLDEPVAFQDPAHQMQVSAWLHQLTSRCVVMSAHDVNWIAHVATHVLALQGDGRWEAGPAVQMLVPERLEVVYGCRWRRAGGALLALA